MKIDNSGAPQEFRVILRIRADKGYRLTENELRDVVKKIVDTDRIPDAIDTIRITAVDDLTPAKA